jgi:hypothetical protein
MVDAFQLHHLRRTGCRARHLYYRYHCRTEFDHDVLPGLVGQHGTGWDTGLQGDCGTEEGRERNDLWAKYLVVVKLRTT